jgi:hypothetical protein
MVIQLTDPISIKATPTRSTLYQGVAVFGICPPVTVVVVAGALVVVVAAGAVVVVVPAVVVVVPAVVVVVPAVVVVCAVTMAGAINNTLRNTATAKTKDFVNIFFIFLPFFYFYISFCLFLLLF